MCDFVPAMQQLRCGAADPLPPYASNIIITAIIINCNNNPIHNPSRFTPPAIQDKTTFVS